MILGDWSSDVCSSDLCPSLWTCPLSAQGASICPESQGDAVEPVPWALPASCASSPTGHHIWPAPSSERSGIIPFGTSYAPCAHAYARTPTCTNIHVSACANAPALARSNTCVPGGEGSMILFSLLGRCMRSAATHFGCPSSCVHAHAVATILAVFNAVSHSTHAGDRPPHHHPGCRKAPSSCALHYMRTIVHKTTPAIPTCL